MPVVFGSRGLRINGENILYDDIISIDSRVIDPYMQTTKYTINFRVGDSTEWYDIIADATNEDNLYNLELYIGSDEQIGLGEDPPF